MLGGTLGVIAQSANVSAIPSGARRDAERPGPRQDQVEQPVGLDLAEAPLAVADDHRGALLLDLQRHAEPVVALLDEVEILRHAEHAVRVVAAEVGLDEVLGDDLRLVGGHAGCGE